MKKIYPLIVFIFYILPGLLLDNAMGQTDPELVYPDEHGILVYVKHANTQESNSDNIIIDYSHCGFMGGGVAIPDIPVRATLYPEFGDDQERIQAAIDYVSGLEPDKNGYRGTILLKAGTYLLGKALRSGNDALQIRTSGVVLRGEGQGPGGTILKTSFETKHRVIATRPQKPSISTSNRTRIGDAYVGSGVFGFNVEDASAYAAGDTIYVRFTPNQTWLDEIYANAYMSDGDLDWDTGTYTINYERVITDVIDDSITIHSPVILPMQTKFGGGEIVKLTFSRQRLSKVGVENMRLIGTGITPTCPADDPNRLDIAILYEFTENSWIRDVTVLHTSNSLFKMWASHYVTIEDCASIEPLGPKRAGYRYTFYFDAASSHNFCQRTYTDDGRHDYVLGPRIPGPNVFLDGVSERGGTQGPHQRWATGTLFDNLKLSSLIALEHRGSSGSGHSWAGIQSTIWNTESPSIICDTPTGHLNYAIGNTGTERLSQYINNTRPGVYRGHYDQHGSHVTVRSLYLEQLDDRLGASAVGNITMPEQLEGNIYSMLLDWKGDGNLAEAGVERLSAPSELSLADLEPAEGSQYIELQWTDNIPDETQFILERSSDGGANYVQLAALPAGTTNYLDEDISQDTYHYRLKAVNETLESNYTYLFVDLFDEVLYANVTFRVNMREVDDLYENGGVWLVTNNEATRTEMTDDDTDSIYTLVGTFMVGKNLPYNFAYQVGPDSANNIVTEQISGDCASSGGYRQLTVPSDDLVLEAFLFGSCDAALPPGTDITDLDGTIIFGSNDDEPWIDGNNGSGSPPGERVEMLIDNDVETKYLVRAVSSWVEVNTSRFTKLNGYTITSANDVPARDPRDWILRAWDDVSGGWITMHTVTDNPVWESRFKTRVWNVENDDWYNRYQLFITDINGDTQGLMQMAELQLFGEVGEASGLILSGTPAVKLYPNPAVDQLNIEWADQPGELMVEIFSLSGRRVYARKNLLNGEAMIQIDLSGQAPGMYLLRLATGDQIITKKFVVEPN